MIANTNKRRRRGHAAVQMAIVASIFFMMLFGIIEYCRFIFYRNIVINASREGARYAVVNIYDNTMVSDTQAKVKTMMMNLDGKLSGYACDVYLSNSSGANTGDATSATFGSYIAVDVYGNYSPLLPTFLKMNSSYKIRAKTIMCSEAN